MEPKINLSLLVFQMLKLQKTGSLLQQTSIEKERLMFYRGQYEGGCGEYWQFRSVSINP